MLKLSFFFWKHIVTVAIRPGYQQGCKWIFFFFETAVKIEAKWRLLQIFFAWCCDIAVNCMELSNMRNHCWLFCGSWIQCICNSKWTRRWCCWRQQRWQQQCGWETKLQAATSINATLQSLSELLMPFSIWKGGQGLT